MKTIALFICSTVGFIQIAYTQQINELKPCLSIAALYGEATLTPEPFGYSLSMQAETQSGWGIGSGIRRVTYLSRFLDENPSFLYYPRFAGKADDIVQHMYLSASYTLSSRKNNKRLTIELGPSLVTTRRTYVNEAQSCGGWFGCFTTHDYHYRFYRSAGFVTRVKAHLPLGRYVGFTAALVGLVNEYQPDLSAEFGITAGLIRRASRKSAK